MNKFRFYLNSVLAVSFWLLTILNGFVGEWLHFLMYFVIATSITFGQESLSELRGYTRTNEGDT